MAGAGDRRLGRLAAYLIGAQCYFLGLGMMEAFANDGWLRSRRTGSWMRTSLAEGLLLGAILGLVAGVAFFIRNERRGPPFARAVERQVEFPPSYITEILAAEAVAPPADRRKMAGFLTERARKTGQSLPPELAAFVERTRGEDQATFP